MTDRSGDESDRALTNAMPPHEPAEMLPMVLTIPSGWTEWYRYKTSRYREVVVSRRRNPFAFFGPAGVFHGIVYLLVWLLPWLEVAGPLALVRYGITRETAFGLLPITSAVLIGGWAAAGILVRRRAREKEQFDRDRMYPPAEYWEGAEDAGE